MTNSLLTLYSMGKDRILILFLISKIRNNIRITTPTTLIQHRTRTIRQDKEIRGIQVGEKRSKIMYLHMIILYI